MLYSSQALHICTFQLHSFKRCSFPVQLLLLGWQSCYQGLQMLAFPLLCRLIPLPLLFFLIKLKTNKQFLLSKNVKKKKKTALPAYQTYYVFLRKLQKPKWCKSIFNTLTHSWASNGEWPCSIRMASCFNAFEVLVWITRHKFSALAHC